MTKATVEDLDNTMDYEPFSAWRRVTKGASFNSPFGTLTVHDYQGRCDHETCYETHGTVLVFALGDRYFRKTGTYDSQDGFQWSGKLTEVKPVKKTVEEFEEVPVYVWDAAGISLFLREWFKTQVGTRYHSYDWTSLYFQAFSAPFTPEGFPYEIKGVEEYAPGEEESNGPVWLIFEINGERYAAKGRNISHVGWDFDGVYELEKVEKKTVTMEVWQ